MSKSADFDPMLDDGQPRRLVKPAGRGDSEEEIVKPAGRDDSDTETVEPAGDRGRT